MLCPISFHYSNIDWSGLLLKMLCSFYDLSCSNSSRMLYTPWVLAIKCASLNSQNLSLEFCFKKSLLDFILSLCKCFHLVNCICTILRTMWIKGTVHYTACSFSPLQQLPSPWDRLGSLNLSSHRMSSLLKDIIWHIKSIPAPPCSQSEFQCARWSVFKQKHHPSCKINKNSKGKCKENYSIYCIQIDFFLLVQVFF